MRRTNAFVQRALLNLERPHVLITGEERADAASLDSWRQWKWMNRAPRRRYRPNRDQRKNCRRDSRPPSP
jgi:hypothetical protein